MVRLVIVESPAKAKKIAGFLGAGWRVDATRGHLRDLPRHELGVAVDDDFRPQYTMLPRKGNLVRRLAKAAQKADVVYLATDPDREGEAIAWHLLQLMRLPPEKPVYRATFMSITEQAVRHALDHPRSLDMAQVEAQQTRRIVDRLVGYLVSPLACRALDGRFSAGRVQSPGLRLVVEREREIAAFTPVIYWTVAVNLDADGQPFTAHLHRIKGSKPQFRQRTKAESVATLLQNAQIWVHKAGRSTTKRQSLPPFTTSSLQQAAANSLNLSPERTMELAQQFYEAGRITYHRTDGVTVAPEPQAAVRQFIADEYGAAYLPEQAPTYTTKTVNAQEAHEAIRPVDVTSLPDATKGDGAALYALIWKRFVASQMAAARYTVTGAIFYAGQDRQQPFPLQLRAHGRELAFDGFLRVYEEPAEDDTPDNEAALLPALTAGQMLQVVDVLISDKQTRAPGRFSEAALIGELEARGIGRPSTFASIIKTLKKRGYVTLATKQFRPTATGERLHDYLVQQFPDVVAYDYTARLEAELDAIAAGETTRLTTLQRFWRDFQPALASAAKGLPSDTPHSDPEPTGETCPECGGALVQRSGQHGDFIGCANYPTCRHTQSPDARPLVLRPAEEHDV